MFDCWADPVVHLLLLKSSVDCFINRSAAWNQLKIHQISDFSKRQFKICCQNQIIFDEKMDWELIEKLRNLSRAMLSLFVFLSLFISFQPLTCLHQLSRVSQNCRLQLGKYQILGLIYRD